MTEPRSRQQLLQRGWYVCSEIELAFMGLSGRAHDLLIILKHLQGAGENSQPSRERLAELLNTSVRTVQSALNELRRKGAITSRRTGHFSRHTAVYGHATVEEIRTLMGAEVQIPAELLAEPDVQESCTSDVQDSRSAPLYKEPFKNNYYGAAAPGPDQHGQTEDQMRNWIPLTDELDPVAALGLNRSQEEPDGSPDEPSGLFPAQEVTPPPTARQRPVRSQAQLDTPLALAIELDTQLREADWDPGPGPVNRTALARNISAWKRDGTTADQIRDMITRYVHDATMRDPGKVPWIDFINKRHKLLASAAHAAEAHTVEQHRDADASYWLGTMAGGR